MMENQDRPLQEQDDRTDVRGVDHRGIYTPATDRPTVSDRAKALNLRAAAAEAETAYARQHQLALADMLDPQPSAEEWAQDSGRIMDFNAYADAAWEEAA